jgi:NifU-like protein involved in Fe-S cluster formation
MSTKCETCPVKSKCSKKNPDLKKENEEWFYSKEVKEHFFKPKNLLVDEPKGFDGTGEVGSPACLLSDVLIHTNSKIDFIKNILVSNNVISHYGNSKNVTKTFKRRYNGEIITIKNQFGENSLTSDHLIYAIKVPSKWIYRHTKYKKSLTPAWFHAENLKKGDICLYPIPNDINNVKYLNVDIKRKKYDFRSKRIPNKIKITGDLLELFGYYIAEGHHRRTEIGFTFSINEEIYVQRVKFLIKKIFGIDVKITKRKKLNRIDISIYNLHISKLFKNLFDRGAVNKKVPDFIMWLNPKLQRKLILGLWRGDGYIDIKRKYPRAVYSTISLSLANQVKLLLLRQGIIPSVYREKEKIIKGVRHRKSYRIHVGDMKSLERLSSILGIKFIKRKRRLNVNIWCDNSYVYIPITNTKKKKMRTVVYNLEVDTDHSYISDSLTLHNCGDVMKLWIWIEKDRIKKCKWQTFGCASAIASTSMLSVMVTEKGGMKISDAKKITAKDILKRLGGLPAIKIHCSVLGDQALRAAINDYESKKKQ